MSVTWRSEDEPAPRPIPAAGRLRAVLRGLAVAFWIAVCLVALGLCRLAERPFHGLGRPWSSVVVQVFSRGALVLLRVRLRVQGRPFAGPGGLVANHASWLDIFVLNATDRVTFVSKAEVAQWPGIGFLARVAGTVFIQRNARESGQQREVMEEYLAHGHKLVFFPEGTSTDGRRILPFKSTLFAAFFIPGISDLQVQPVTILYRAPQGQDPRFYAWWGDMDFADHALKLLAQKPQGSVTVIYHDPLPVRAFADRKALSAACEARVRDGLSLLPVKD